jgi:hypothetical protein
MSAAVNGGIFFKRIVFPKSSAKCRALNEKRLEIYIESA